MVLISRKNLNNRHLYNCAMAIIPRNISTVNSIANNNWNNNPNVNRSLASVRLRGWGERYVGKRIIETSINKRYYMSEGVYYACTIVCQWLGKKREEGVRGVVNFTKWEESREERRESRAGTRERGYITKRGISPWHVVAILYITCRLHISDVCITSVRHVHRAIVLYCFARIYSFPLEIWCIICTIVVLYNLVLQCDCNSI